jgi:protocatechuate 3,4-dioxygenase beta subunit
MADETKDTDAKDEPKAKAAAPQVQQTPAQQASQAFAESQKAAADLHLTEGPKGGRYIVDGQAVDAEGRPVKDKD